MKIPVQTAAELGAVMRLVRKQQNIRADDLAGHAGVGPVFVLDVENGKPTVQLERVLKVLAQLGIKVSLELPQDLSENDVALTTKRADASGLRALKNIAQSLSRTHVGLKDPALANWANALLAHFPGGSAGAPPTPKARPRAGSGGSPRAANSAAKKAKTQSLTSQEGFGDGVVASSSPLVAPGKKP